MTDEVSQVRKGVLPSEEGREEGSAQFMNSVPIKAVLGKVNTDRDSYTRTIHVLATCLIYYYTRGDVIVHVMHVHFFCS